MSKEHREPFVFGKDFLEDPHFSHLDDFLLKGVGVKVSPTKTFRKNGPDIKLMPIPETRFLKKFVLFATI